MNAAGSRDPTCERLVVVKKVEIETNDLWVLPPPRACAEEGCLQDVTTFHSVALLRDPGTS